MEGVGSSVKLQQIYQHIDRLEKEFSDISLLSADPIQQEKIRMNLNFLIKIHFKHILARKDVKDLFAHGTRNDRGRFVQYATKFGFHLSTKEWLNYLQANLYLNAETSAKKVTFMEALADGILYRVPLISIKAKDIAGQSNLSNLFTLEEIKNYRNACPEFPKRVDVVKIMKDLEDNKNLGKDAVYNFPPPRGKAFIEEPGTNKTLISRANKGVIKYDAFIDYLKGIIQKKQNKLSRVFTEYDHFYIAFGWYENYVFNHGPRILPEYADMVITDDPPPENVIGLYKQYFLPDSTYIADTINTKDLFILSNFGIINNTITIPYYFKIIRATNEYIKILSPTFFFNGNRRKFTPSIMMISTYDPVEKFLNLFNQEKMELNMEEFEELKDAYRSAQS